MEEKNNPAQKEVKFDIDNGQVFFAEEITVIHNPTKLILDFKNVTPRFDVRNNDFQPISIRHNVIVMDMHVGKSFLASLKENLSRYEKDYGKIEEPKALQKAMRKADYAAKKEKDSKPDSPSYLG